MFERILIACRGEVAARVARTCRRVGLETVGAHVEHDLDGVHIEACDEALSLGEGAATYRDVEAIVRAAQACNAQAVHTGYGLGLAELELSRALAERGISLIGPAPDALEKSFDRLAVREAAIEAGVRVLPASAGAPDSASLRAEIAAIGLPIVIKSTRGPGEPEALPVATDDEQLESALASAGTPAFAERWLDRPRHVEVQLISDGEEAIVLGDRECSLRKEHRRLLSESPARALDQLFRREAVRGAIWDASMEIAANLRIRGIFGAQFLIDDEGTFHFVGVRAGLQEEHSATEMCTALDLVEMQLRLAAGESMPAEAQRAEPTGAALIARIDASTDPRTGRPFEARVESARFPPAPPGKVRLEAGVKVGSRVEPDHDPLVATVTTYAPTRHDALLVLDRILAEIHIAPLVTNLRLLRKALNHESMRAGQYDEGFLDRI